MDEESGKNYLKSEWDRSGIPAKGWSGNKSFYTSQGHRLRYGYAPASAVGKKARGTLVLTTGYNEQAELYSHAITLFQEMGFNVYAFDWHNHGLSGRENPDDPTRPSERGLERHARDLHDFVRGYTDAEGKKISPAVKHAPENGPLLFSTHSMGGHNTMLALERYPDLFDAGIMTAPLFDIAYKSIPRPVVRGIFRMASKIGIGHHSPPRPKQIIDEFRLSVINMQKSLIRRGRHFNVNTFPPLARKIQMMASVFGLGGATKKMCDYLHEKGVDITNRMRSVPEKKILSGRHYHRLKMEGRFLEQRIATPTFRWIENSFPTSDEIMEEENLDRIKARLMIASATNDDLVENDSHRKIAEYRSDITTHLMLEDSSHAIWFEKENIFNPLKESIKRFSDVIVDDYVPPGERGDPQNKWKSKKPGSIADSDNLPPLPPPTGTEGKGGEIRP